MTYRKQENAFRKCRDALCDGPDDPWVIVVMMIGCFCGLLLCTAIVYGLKGIFN